jgi:hypothetical protein
MVKPDLTPEEIETLERAAEILRRSSDVEDTMYTWDESSYSGCSAYDAASVIAEMVGRASGRIQYEDEIGPKPKPITMKEFVQSGALPEALDKSFLCDRFIFTPNGFREKINSESITNFDYIKR